MNRFLQSNSCAVAINERDALQEHGLATVNCVLTAVGAFDSNYQEQARLLRLVKGLYALHVYSTEYWTEYLLENARVGHGLGSFPRLLSAASHLAENLKGFSSAVPYSSEPCNTVTDYRIQFLDGHPDIKTQVEKALRGRSSDKIESDIFDQTSKFFCELQYL
jgi:hypothetical protein